MAGESGNAHRITALCDMLWGFLQDLDRIRHQKRKPSVDKVLKVAHAVSQLSGSYLKAAEVEAVMEEIPRLKAQVQQLMAAHNGHDRAPARTQDAEGAG